MPMLPAAPGRFSITTGCAHIAESFSPTRRGMRSDAPPGANGTITCTGRCGQLCAFAVPTKTRDRKSERIMAVLLNDLGDGALQRDDVKLARIRIVTRGGKRVVGQLGVAKEKRRALQRADHRARLVALRVVQRRADRVREFAGLAAELPVAVAGARRALRDADRDQQLLW